jgi:asparagine synthase (glutamine-hydrolysing)
MLRPLALCVQTPTAWRAVRDARRCSRGLSPESCRFAACCRVGGAVSAICGVIGLDGRPWSRADLAGMRAVAGLLARDGGDGWAGMAGRSGVAVAAALRHSTPEDAADRQPAQNRDGSLVLVGDLRVDNRAELSALLGLEDVRSAPDSAFVLAAYERWGHAFLERLYGEFALAIVDRRRGGLLLARDHAGIRPLVIHERAGLLAFASTALALTGFGGVGHALDSRHAMEVLALVYSTDRTFVEDVRWLPPATALWASADGVRRWAWWDPDPDEIVDLGSFGAHAGELREVFDRGVSRLMRSTGKVGAMVSGGLDSTSSAATAARLLAPDRLPTYTSAPPPAWIGAERPNWDPDESPLVKKLAELHTNISPTVVHVEPGVSPLDLHQPLWELGAIPPRNPCNWLWFHAIVVQAAQDGVKALISGRLGNLFFSPDGPDWLADLLRVGRFGTALREMLAWNRLNGDSVYMTLRSHVVYPLLPRRARRLIRIARGRPDPASAWLAGSALRPDIHSELALLTLRPTLDERRRSPFRQYAATALLTAAGQAENAAALAAVSGIEERDPTIDRGVIEVGMRQPESVRRHDGITRAAARAAMSDRLPPEIGQRTRRGEQLPDWLDLMTAARPQLAHELEELEQHPTSRELIDTARLRRLMDRWPDRTASADPGVVTDYRRVLLRALVISRYLRWFEQRGATATRACFRG